MTVTIVVGAQFGDCGKGTIVDFLAADADAVVRFNGGNNAGHTVVINEKVYKSHLMPVGAYRAGVLNIIGNGVVIDPDVLIEEMDMLEREGFDINLVAGEKAHVIMPWSRAMDGAQEARRGKGKIGTTGRGIGPTYGDKAERTTAMRMEDLMDPGVFAEKVERIYALKADILGIYGRDMPISKDELLKKASVWRDRLSEYVGDSVYELNVLVDSGARIYLEGAQGFELDVDHGSFYPYVTSSNPSAGGACTGSGISPTKVDEVIGVAKAYVTRVGEGPFITELGEYEEAKGEKKLTGQEAKELLIKINKGEASGLEIGRYLRAKGSEYGATTGRPRRTGWLDLVGLTRSNMVNRYDSIAMTKIDVLGGLDDLKICCEYDINGEHTDVFPTNRKLLALAEPVYKTFVGWTDMTSGEWKERAAAEDLPESVYAYVGFVSDYLDVPINLISYGPGRSEKAFL